MIIDPWKNIVFDLRDCEHYFGEYLKDNYMISLTSWPRSDPNTDGTSIIGEIGTGTQIKAPIFKNNLREFYKSFPKNANQMKGKKIQMKITVFRVFMKYKVNIGE